MGQFNYGVCLENGLDVALDSAKAAEYYEVAADQEQATAHDNHGFCLTMGRSLARDVAKAVSYSNWQWISDVVSVRPIMDFACSMASASIGIQSRRWSTTGN